MNTQPVIDGGVRGMIASSLGGILSLIVLLSGLPEEVALLLMPTVLLLSFVLGGIYDAFARPRLR
jgi:hypothetical protein